MKAAACRAVLVVLVATAVQGQVMPAGLTAPAYVPGFSNVPQCASESLGSYISYDSSRYFCQWYARCMGETNAYVSHCGLNTISSGDGHCRLVSGANMLAYCTNRCPSENSGAKIAAPGYCGKYYTCRGDTLECTDALGRLLKVDDERSDCSTELCDTAEASQDCVEAGYSIDPTSVCKFYHNDNQKDCPAGTRFVLNADRTCLACGSAPQGSPCATSPPVIPACSEENNAQLRLTISPSATASMQIQLQYQTLSWYLDSLAGVTISNNAMVLTNGAVTIPFFQGNSAPYQRDLGFDIGFQVPSGTARQTILRNNYGTACTNGEQPTIELYLEAGVSATSRSIVFQTASGSLRATVSSGQWVRVSIQGNRAATGTYTFSGRYQIASSSSFVNLQTTNNFNNPSTNANGLTSTLASTSCGAFGLGSSEISSFSISQFVMYINCEGLTNAQ